MKVRTMKMTDITQILMATMTLIMSMITAFLIPYLKEKIGEKKFAELSRWVSVAVTAAEQIYVGSGRGEEKKAYVLEFLNSKGFTVDTNVLDNLIESAVYAMKNGV